MNGLIECLSLRLPSQKTGSNATWRLYQELSEMKDEDAAQEQRLVALTQEALRI